MLYMTRPPITDDEAAVLKKLANAFEASPGRYCTGTFTPEIEFPYLLYTFQSSNLESRVCPLTNTTEKQLEELYSQCTPSPSDRDKELVHDESHGLAKELPSSRFGLNFDPLRTQHGIVAAISAFMEEAPGVDIRMGKLHSYGVGDYVEAHLDTSKGDSHIGTLIIGLPSDCIGGQLLLRDSMKQTATIDWSTEGRHDGGGFPWVFFSETEHEVLPVKSGFRSTLDFDVFSTYDITYQVPVSKFNIDVESSAIYKKLTAALKNKEFLTNGGRLAFGLSREYPAEKMGADLLSVLKGSDMILWQAFRALGLEIKVITAYEPIDIDETSLIDEDDEDGDDSEGESDRYPPDNFSYLKNGDVMLTSGFLKKIHGWHHVGGEHGQSLYYLLTNDAEAELERDLIWVRWPLRYSMKDILAHDTGPDYDPSIAYSCVAGVLIAIIPATGLSGRV